MINPSHVSCILAVCLTLVGPAMMWAQKQGNPQSAPNAGREYRLEVKYTAGVAQQYEFTEKTSVVRTHSDSSTKDYQREVKHYLTVRCVESMNDVSKLVINVDSLIYSFTAGGVLVDYDSQKDITPKNFADLNNYIGPLNRPFTITINSYGEVSKVEGEQIDFWRDYINENAADLDSLTALIWQQSLADENLLNLGDLQKGAVPGLKVGVDSSWKHTLTLRANGVLYRSKIRSRFAQNTGGIYVINTTDTLAAVAGPVRTYGVPMPGQILEGNAAVKHTVVLRNTGVIEELETAMDAWYRAKALNEVYTERMNTTYSWKLTGQYQW